MHPLHWTSRPPLSWRSEGEVTILGLIFGIWVLLGFLSWRPVDRDDFTRCHEIYVSMCQEYGYPEYVGFVYPCLYGFTFHSFVEKLKRYTKRKSYYNPGTFTTPRPTFLDPLVLRLLYTGALSTIPNHRRDTTSPLSLCGTVLPWGDDGPKKSSVSRVRWEVSFGRTLERLTWFGTRPRVTYPSGSCWLLDLSRIRSNLQTWILWPRGFLLPGVKTNQQIVHLPKPFSL